MNRLCGRLALACAVGCVLVPFAGAQRAWAAGKGPKPRFSEARAFDVSPTLRELAATPQFPFDVAAADAANIRPERDLPRAADAPFAGDEAILSGITSPAAALWAPPQVLANFEGVSNQDNFSLFGGRVNPPDPVGDVGPSHYVEMVNLAVAVFDKQGNRLLGPIKLGTFWEGFPVTDCAGNAGDPIVLYDQLEDRWILSQFTAAGPTYWNCVAISQTGDPTGAYYRYAFITQPDPDLPGGTFFPDYPKYGVWTHSYVLTTRDFGEVDEYGISVYALEKNKMIAGSPKARAVQFFIDSNEVPLNLMGDGLLPADIDGTRRPQDHWPVPIVGTQDDGAGYGASADALNIWELFVKWNATPEASLTLATQLPVATFDSIFPCGPSRGCIPQPGITNRDQWLDVLSYRQRPTWRLAYRNFGKYESLVTTQAVEARQGIAGMRWYELRRVPSIGTKAGTYSLYQQGTFAPEDGVHRWMGSIAQDWQGNLALGYSVSNATDVYPGIRFTGRLNGDPLGEMTVEEGTIINGTGVQRTANSRWGDYTSMNVDPTDDCTFWYVNEYYTLAGQQSSTAGWQTRIGSFKMPGCTAKQ